MRTLIQIESIAIARPTPSQDSAINPAAIPDTAAYKYLISLPLVALEAISEDKVVFGIVDSAFR